MLHQANLLTPFEELSSTFKGELFFDNSAAHEAQKLVYSTDASVYQEKPLAVAVPKTVEDIKSLIAFANQHRLTLIPRAAGTSLAGQVVGNGLIVDISKYFNQILEINEQEQYVRVQPGVIRDDLNVALRPFGLMFGPETSTANRAMIGGMIGNNSCGLHSIVWGDTRQNLLEVKGFLSNGQEVTFSSLSLAEVAEKTHLNSLEGVIYKGVSTIVNNPKNIDDIEKGYPKKSLTRRNTGYALDFLIPEEGKESFNMCELIAGSEGTLVFVTEAKLKLLPLPPKKDALVCVHFSSLAESLLANIVILKHQPMASELVDKYIMDFTKGHPVYQHNRFFIEGEPEALLMVEFFAETQQELDFKTSALIADLKLAGLGYAYPVVYGPQTKLAWDVRKAGLGLIRNLPGDNQPVNLIEDCAVAPEDLPAYIEELQQLLNRHNLKASYYAHAGAGELHVEPMINLKTSEGKELFRTVLKETAVLVKKHQGSLSGEHGDGRLRGEFIKDVLGAEVYELLREVKQLFDPLGVFNANKIVETPPMNEFLRYEADKEIKPIKTIFDFSKNESILRLAEKCSGSGDCRKTHVSGGTMCPSYMATRQEKDTTRARANILRQFLTNSQGDNPFNHKEIKEVMDLCLSCKACKSECPSSVDVAKMKAEFLQHYYDANGIPFRTRVIANFTKSQALGAIVPSIYNALIANNFTSKIIKKIIGFAPDRSLPKVGKITLRSWKKQHDKKQLPKNRDRKVYLFCDEFTNYNDVEIGATAIQLLEKLGYEVVIPRHVESGRTYLSKGLVRDAKVLANKNVTLLADLISIDTPLLGIEPSALLTFRDEYPELVDAHLLQKAKHLAQNSFLIEEFLLQEFEAKKISADQFTADYQLVKLHGHCYQKSLNALTPTEKILGMPANYTVEMIPSGCCGMAGSFGYEEEHYEVSMQVGELVLLPAVRNAAEDTIIAAAGTSCRHQIKDGTQKIAKHPVEILWEALK
ncbi:MAG: FAD-linked oxidase C-terminal domain-containing protein [Pedobacter sp.]|uniref:FAD-binding and (Fe-S)-binding domain-containing protein n=1 Tax=Pedobacter sp. TaxID=1411316 RepID=UPI0028086520|nr:FAD-linked oxidase C-terminal domain-containing protein [Pedobacter sp.]MDQ8006698.1 FAD-linked oxidase C-terminal domain-containing protein [Pedobacter sp.]